MRARLKEAKRRLEEELDVECRANAAYEAYRARGVAADGRPLGRRPKPYEPPATPAGKVNVTDPDSRNIKAPRGYLQGYNAQAATNERQIVIAAEVSADSPDFGHLEPMVSAAQDELESVGVTETPAVVVADAGYWHQAQMETVIDRGIQVLIPPDALKRKSARPGWDGGAYAFMRRVLDTDHGGGLYRKRQGMIEPVFADTKFNRRIDRFQRRGRSLSLRMAADHRHPQPAQALQAPDGARRGLKGTQGRKPLRLETAAPGIRSRARCRTPPRSGRLRNGHRRIR